MGIQRIMRSVTTDSLQGLHRREPKMFQLESPPTRTHLGRAMASAIMLSKTAFAGAPEMRRSFTSSTGVPVTPSFDPAAISARTRPMVALSRTHALNALVSGIPASYARRAHGSLPMESCFA